MRLFWTVAIVALVWGWVSMDNNYPSQIKDIVDVSWPNCTLINNPTGQHGIVGINGGLDFRPNPCTAKEAGWFKTISAYVNTGYPGKVLAQKYKDFPKQCRANDERCLAYNYGFNAGRYDIEYASLNGVMADHWWLDVENVNSWSDNALVNRAALQGMYDAVSKYMGSANVGYYSYPGQWNTLTGSWHNNIDAWAATGSADLRDALNACSKDGFTGGQVVLSQYTPSLDVNILCSQAPSAGGF